MSDYYNGTDIAIIGMAGRFPGAKNVESFWRNLCEGVESVRFLTPDELISFGANPDEIQDPLYVNAVAQLDDPELFDAAFFGINHREAEVTDPQHRVFLECAWEALENAGYDAERYEGAIGVFGGATINTYLLLNLSSNPDVISSIDDVQLNIGNGGDFLTTRVSYKLNFKGPSHTIQSACSTSLVSVHVACQSLLNEECDIALAGGVSINVKHRTGYRHVPGGITSPDGHCRTFDSDAQGTIFGSGVGIIVLKRLGDALRDRDCIHAVIRGSAINNDGSVKVGYTAPGVDGQARVIAEAMSNADVNAETITYIEAHGTGTQMGDPIEVQALTKAHRATTEKSGYCAIGSVKTNIGHLDAAAGIAGLIKTVLALKHKMLPPSLHFKQANPGIDFESTPFYVNTKLSEWKVSRAPRRAGVSAFGVGGTNAHVIVEEAPPQSSPENSRPWQIVVLSAKTATALEAATKNLAEQLSAHRGSNLADVAYTLHMGRRPFAHRRMVVCNDVCDVVNALTASDTGRVLTSFQEKSDRPVVYMFAGQGSQHINMAAQLYLLEPAFAHHLDLCSDLLAPLLNLDIRHILFPPSHLHPSAHLRLNLTQFTQPALFALQYSLAQLWISWGVRPVAFIGHSLGEYVAACLAGVFSLDVALRLVVSRAALMQSLQPGSMLAVAIDEEGLRQTLSPGLSVAAVNGPRQCVVSGAAADIEGYEREMAGRGITCHRLATSHAFHSHLMDPILDTFSGQLKSVDIKPPQIPYISNVTGTWITDREAASVDYWLRQLRETVRFDEGIRELLNEPDYILLEVGPGRSLTRLAMRHPARAPEQSVFSSLPDPKDPKPDLLFLLNTLGELWLAGARVDWKGFYYGEKRQRVELPTYPFEGKRYWIERKEKEKVEKIDSAKIEKRTDIEDWFYLPSWKRSLLPRSPKQGRLAENRLRWIVFIDEFGVGASLARRLKGEAQDVISVSAGENFSRSGEENYTINPARLEDYRLLFKELCDSDRNPDHIIHLWSLTQSNDTRSSNDLFEKIQDRGLYSLLFIMQGLEREGATQDIQISVASNNVCSVYPSETIYAEKATILGPCKVIPQEYHGLACRFIDVVISKSESKNANKIAEQLLAECVANNKEMVIAYRDNCRWVQVFDRVRIESGDESTILRERGVYLIIGKMEGIGFALAQHLARKVQAKLAVLTASREDKAGSASKIKTLEMLGAKVLVLHADIIDGKQIRDAISRVEKEFAALHGVIYALGLDGLKAYKSISETDIAHCRSQLAPKTDGLMALQAALGDRPLDFCALMSSLSSILGGVGSAAYTSANLFMDAFTYEQNRRGAVAWTSINWDAWQFKEQREQIREISEDMSRLAMTPEEGVTVFERVLENNSADQIITSTWDLDARIARWLNSKSLRSSVRLSNVESPASFHPRPQMQSPYVAPHNELEQIIANIWQKAFGIEQVGMLDNFFDLGGDSLLAIQVVSELNKKLKAEIPVVSLYEALTIKSLADLLARNREEDLSAEDDESTGRGQKALKRKLYQESQRSRKKRVLG